MKICLRKKIQRYTTIIGILIATLSGLVMLNFVVNEVDQRLYNAYDANHKQIQYALENAINSLSSISHSFTPYGNLGESIMEYSQGDISSSRQSELLIEMKKEMNVLLFANINIGTCAICNFEFNENIISTMPIKADFDSVDLPVLFISNQLTYFGPHESSRKFNNDYVLSCVRLINPNEDNSTYVYAETDFSVIQKILDYDKKLDNEIAHLIVDSNNNVVFSDNPEVHSEVYKYSDIINEIKDYHILRTENVQGWSFVTLVNRFTIKRERWLVLYQYIIVIPFVVALSILLSWLLYRIINKPINIFYCGVVQMGEGDFKSQLPYTQIREFDVLVDKLNEVKKTISDLIIQVRLKEEKRSNAELEKLRAQINPHLMLNTLNSIHWLAMTNQQVTIGSMASSLSNILAYNMHKDKRIVSISEEFEYAELYLNLQLNKYDFSYGIINNCEDVFMEANMPRLILQPIIENCILHNAIDNLKITIIFEHIKNGILIKILDNGKGLDNNMLEKLRDYSSTEADLGIGLSFVISEIHSYFNGEAKINFRNIYPGLEVSIFLPYKGEKGDD